MKKLGLILAKFAPFHICHQYIIDMALKEVDDLTIIMYDCPDKTNIPLNVRAQWVRHFYPRVHVIEGWDAPNRHEDTGEVKRIQENYVKNALNGKKITHFYNADFYGDHMSKFLGAVNRRVDKDDEKRQCPVRATLIRGDRYSYRKAMHPMVYRDILIKVAFIGAPSEEQTKLIKRLATKLQTIYIENNLMSLFNSVKVKKSFNDSINFYHTGKGQYKSAYNKNKIYKANEYLLYDSTSFIDHLLSIATHKQFDEKLFKLFSEDMRSYDLVFVNEAKKNNITKYLNIDNSIFLNQILSNLDTLGVKYQILSGTFGEKQKKSRKSDKDHKGKIQIKGNLMNYLSGNVNSPIPIPLYYPKDIVSGKGPYVINKNGDRYIDLWMGYGALLFGHADPGIIQVIQKSIKNGWFFSYQTFLEKELSETIHNIIPSAERVRFATTGSDAVAYAIRASRAYTGRKKVLSVIGGYHGVHEGIMPGEGTVNKYNPILVPFNDIKDVEEKLKNKQYACFILEPILANSGCTPPDKDYLRKVKSICIKTGTVLIFDEIVTGFRVGLHGAQGYFNVVPDLSLFSKAIASGLPLSVVCGKKKIMNTFIPTGNVFFANTFNGNPLSLIVAKTVINKLKNSNVYSKNEDLGDQLRKYITEQINNLKLPACVQGISSMMTLAFGCKSFKQGIKMEKIDDRVYNLFIQKMAKRRVLLPPLPTETIFLSPVHEVVMGDIKKAFKYSLEEIKKEIY